MSMNQFIFISFILLTLSILTNKVFLEWKNITDQIFIIFPSLIHIISLTSYFHFIISLNHHYFIDSIPTILVPPKIDTKNQ